MKIKSKKSKDGIIVNMLPQHKSRDEDNGPEAVPTKAAEPQAPPKAEEASAAAPKKEESEQAAPTAPPAPAAAKPIPAPKPSAESNDAEESGDEDEEPEEAAKPIPEPEPIVKAPVHHMTKAEREKYYETSELTQFSKEEDNAIKVQLNGQELIAQTGPTLIREINTEVKNATPNWVSGKWVSNMKKAASNAQKRDAHKKAHQAALAQRHKH